MAIIQRLNGTLQTGFIILLTLEGMAPFVNEVVDFILENKVEEGRGNYDFILAIDAEHCDFKYEDPDQTKLSTQ